MNKLILSLSLACLLSQSASAASTCSDLFQTTSDQGSENTKSEAAHILKKIDSWILRLFPTTGYSTYQIFLANLGEHGRLQSEIGRIVQNGDLDVAILRPETARNRITSDSRFELFFKRGS